MLAVGDQTPDKFGYASFGVQIIKPLSFWAGAVIDNPMIMAPFPQFTEAKLTVYAKDGWHYTFKMFAGLNNLDYQGRIRNLYICSGKRGISTNKSRI